MTVDHFPPEVIEELKWYVYRLVDPRNGETFYVGKGKGNRVFEHVKGIKVGDDYDEDHQKKQHRINQIQSAGLEVGHIIHRHGMAESTAKSVEAALIGAYPGLANKVRGEGSEKYGARHAKEIIAEHTAEYFTVEEKLILISIGRRWHTHDVYEAVRGCWKINKNKAKYYKLVLAHYRGLVRGAYRPIEWLPGTKENFPDAGNDEPDRIGFVGEEAEREVRDKYVGKRVPAKYRKKGAANPIRYCYP